jgi:hypothetical protein
MVRVVLVDHHFLGWRGLGVVVGARVFLFFVVRGEQMQVLFIFFLDV